MGKKCRKNHPGPAESILQMARADQAARAAGMAAKTTATDHENKERLVAIIAAIGWPSRSKVGDEAAHAAWLLVQHADHDPAFQRRCLELMSAEPSEEVLSADLAYLTDRVLVNEGQPQLYGTQWFIDENGAYGPEAICDPDKLDDRRKTVGMEPFAAYAEAMREIGMNPVLETVLK